MATVARTVSPLLAERAAVMRRFSTASERALFGLLRRRRLGVRFIRQVPVRGTRFIVDFLAPQQRLVVEVDGAYHARRVRADARRDAQLARLGYRVLRLDAELVLRRPHEAVARIREALGAA